MAERTKFWLGVSLAAIPAGGLLWLVFSDPEAAVARRHGESIGVATPKPGEGSPPEKTSAPAETAAPTGTTLGVSGEPGGTPEEREASCRACQKASCGPLHAECFSEGGASGDAGNVERARLCGSVVECVRRTNCAKDGREACYCGEGATVEACLTAPGKGPCRDIIERAAESKDPRTVAERFIDPKWPVGSAFRLVNCMSDRCKLCEPPNAVGVKG